MTTFDMKSEGCAAVCCKQAGGCSFLNCASSKVSCYCLATGDCRVAALVAHADSTISASISDWISHIAIAIAIMVNSSVEVGADLMKGSVARYEPLRAL